MFRIVLINSILILFFRHAYTIQWLRKSLLRSRYVTSSTMHMQSQLIANAFILQAASAIENLNMESPVKKLDFGAADKENKPNQAAELQRNWTKIVEGSKIVETKKEESKTVAPGIKAEEADEPLLQENPQRFVLFPIKYHEVSDAF